MYWNVAPQGPENPRNIKNGQKLAKIRNFGPKSKNDVIFRYNLWRWTYSPNLKSIACFYQKLWAFSFYRVLTVI